MFRVSGSGLGDAGRIVQGLSGPTSTPADVGVGGQHRCMGSVLNFRTTTSQRCEAVPRRACIEGS